MVMARCTILQSFALLAMCLLASFAGNAHAALVPFDAEVRVTVALERIGVHPEPPASFGGAVLLFGFVSEHTDSTFLPDWAAGHARLGGGLTLGGEHKVTINKIDFEVPTRHVRATVAGRRMLLATWRASEGVGSYSGYTARIRLTRVARREIRFRLHAKRL
jgi:hypothetical protein